MRELDIIELWPGGFDEVEAGLSNAMG